MTNTYSNTIVSFPMSAIESLISGKRSAFRHILSVPCAFSDEVENNLPTCLWGPILVRAITHRDRDVIFHNSKFVSLDGLRHSRLDRTSYFHPLFRILGFIDLP